MTRHIALTLLLITFAATASAAELRGTWTAEVSESDPSKIYFQINRRHSNSGRTMQLGWFSGLSATQVQSATQQPVLFERRGEAGLLAFEGTFKEGFGAGQFTFTPNPAFLDKVRALGVSTEPGGKHRGKERDLDERLLHYTINDLTTEFIRSMQAVGYDVSLDEYFSFRIFNISPQLVRDLAALGYRDIGADDLIASQIHGVKPEYIRKMTAEGFRDLSLQDLISFRIHGVSGQFVQELRELGYDNIPGDKLVAMRIHGVTARFIREMKAAGYSNIPVDKLIAMRIHGVDAVFVKKMNGM